MIIIGLDPGTTRIGYGIIEDKGQNLRALEYGVLTKNGRRDDLILQSHKALNKLLAKYSPQKAGLERLFYFKNSKTVIAVSEMRGSLLLALALRSIPVSEFTPLQVKQALSGYGRADKDQVQRMVRLLLKIDELIAPDDAADALAIAICCAHSKL